MMNTDLDQLADRLRSGVGKEPHQRAAENLLIDHGYWLSRASFVDRAVTWDNHEDNPVIVWSSARRYLDTEATGSTTERAVLDLAVAIGEDRYRFATMGAEHRNMIRAAVAAALPSYTYEES